MIEEIAVGTPVWVGSFGCITWLGESAACVRFLQDGEPKIIAVVPYDMVALWVQNWIDVREQDGRIEEVDI